MTPPEVDVAVLGPVQIHGAALPFGRSAARELVVYLALHRQGARNDTWAEALWPTRPVSPSTVHSTASDGVEHLPRGGRLLRLGDSVGTDVERFAALASGSDPRGWRDALGLVRGAPFDGLRLSDWTIFDGTHAQLESMVVLTALKGAGHALEQGDGAEAEWMIRQALPVSPYDERLYRVLLRAAEVQGNRVRLRSTLTELLSMVAESEDSSGGGGTPHPSSTVHPRTRGLYLALARGPAGAARGWPTRL